MEELEPYLKSLKDSIQLLLKEYHHLQKENKQLRSKQEELETIISAKEEKVNQLEQKIDAGKLGVQHLGEEDKLKLRERIEYYLSDIEKCLALLNA